MPTTQPSSLSWTVRFKYHKTTVLLHLDPLQTISSVKSDLLEALAETCPDGLIHDVSLPADANDFQFALPRDPFDIEKGWQPINTEPEIDGASETGKRKGRAEEKTLKGVGVKDNAVLAFRWAVDDDDYVQVKKNPEVDEGLGVEDEEQDEDTRWDVVIPSFEDEYGVMAAGDIGVLKEYDG